MSLQRINRIQVAIAGLVVAVGLALLFIMLFARPLQTKIKRAEGERDEYAAYAATRPAVEKKLKEAQDTEKKVNANYKKILDTRMPKLDLNDPIAATMRMWDFPDKEQAVMDRWFASTGARVSGYSFPQWGTAMPSSFPNSEARMLDPLNWNLTVEVKDFPALMDWLLTIPKAPRFMVMHSVSIQGPRQPGQPLVAQIPVTLYQWTGVEPARMAAPAAAGGEGGAGGGMGRGGMRGGGGMGRGGMRGGGGMGRGGMRGGGGGGGGGGGAGGGGAGGEAGAGEGEGGA